MSAAGVRPGPRAGVGVPWFNHQSIRGLRPSADSRSLPSNPLSALAENTRGFVLRLRPLTDTSLIVHWLTAEHGRLATVAKGARQPKSSFAGKLDLAFECDFAFQRARRGELHNLREVSVVDSRPALRTDYGYLTQLAYAVALIEQVTEIDTPLPEAHALFADFVSHLPARPVQPRNIYAFELKLLAGQGLAPDLNDRALPPGARLLVGQLQTGAWAEIATLRPAAADVRAVRQFLQGFLLHHTGRVPRGRAEALGGA